jgi:hypothetical protein
VAPTLLELMGLPIPAAMGGHSLLIGHDRDIKMDVRAAG